MKEEQELEVIDVTNDEPEIIYFSEFEDKDSEEGEE